MANNDFSALSPAHRPTPAALLLYALLFLLAVLVLLPALGEPTALTGKDEFFLGLRTPMEMMARDEWLIPFLDDVPRIRKPPLLYWLGRVAYETLGISLFSARLVGVFFAALLTISLAGMARQLGSSWRVAVLAALTLLGCLGLHTEARRFMLDIPVAALSATALWSLTAGGVCWRSTSSAAFPSVRQLVLLITAFVLLALGFLLKGPIVAVVAGSGVLAFVGSGWWSWRRLLSAKSLALLTALIVLWAALALPWFFWVRHSFPQDAAQILGEELASRQFWHLSPNVLGGLAVVSAPWIVAVVCAAYHAVRRAFVLPNRLSPSAFATFTTADHALPPPAVMRALCLWLIISFAPFFFIRTFERYLAGSLVPMMILLAWLWPLAMNNIARRLGLLLALATGGTLTALVFWFRLQPAAVAAWLIVALYFIWAWYPALSDKENRRRQTVRDAHLLLAPLLHWMVVMAWVFPALGVNAVPASVVALGQTQAVAMFAGPQPALLPILSGQAHRHYDRLQGQDIERLQREKTPIFVSEFDLPHLQLQLDVHGAGAGANANAKNKVQLKRLGQYQTLASHGSGLRFARPHATRDDWLRAVGSRQLTPLMTTVFCFQLIAADNNSTHHNTASTQTFP